MWRFKSWRRGRILRQAVLPQELWNRVVAGLPILHGLTDVELKHLQDLVILFLHEKYFLPIKALLLTDEMRLIIAAQACLPILNLGLDCYDGWVTIIVYPAGFIAEHEHMDAAGVVHSIRRPSAGGSWQQGPVVLSWEGIERSGSLDGFNVIVHEFAHKLDMLNGTANGFPPLHAGMAIEEWTTAFTLAYEAFRQGINAGVEYSISEYAAESPAEFFAVLSEVFFEAPHALRAIFPAVYDQLEAFYRQDPALRMPFEYQPEMGISPSWGPG